MKGGFRASQSIIPSRPSAAVELELEFASGKELLEALQAHDGIAELAYSCPSAPGVPAEITLGAIVPAVFRVGPTAREFRAHLCVLEKNTSDSTHSLRLSFLAEELDRQELITLAAKGESIPYLRRGAERLPCAMRVDAYLDESGYAGEATDVSDRGVHIALDPAKFRFDSRLVLVFEGAPGGVGGRVVSIVRSGPSRGIGVEFVIGSPAERDHVKAAVARARASAPSR